MNKKGYLVVLDGVEGCGKTTQTELLARAFESAMPSAKVLQTLQPGGTPLGAEVRHELLHSPVELSAGQEAIGFSYDRMHHVANVVQPVLNAGGIVVCDRWASSTWAYQGVAGELGTEIIEQLTALATNSRDPNVLIVLDIDPAVGFRRKKGDDLDRIERKSLEYHQKVREGFLDYVFHHPGFAYVISVQDRPRDDVQREIIALVNDHLGLSLPVLDV